MVLAGNFLETTGWFGKERTPMTRSRTPPSWFWFWMSTSEHDGPVHQNQDDSRQEQNKRAGSTEQLLPIWTSAALKQAGKNNEAAAASRRANYDRSVWGGGGKVGSSEEGGGVANWKAPSGTKHRAR